MKFKIGSCVCEINDDDVKYWENLSRPYSCSVLADCIGVVMNDGSRYVYKHDTGLMFIPASVKNHAFYESFRTYFD